MADRITIVGALEDNPDRDHLLARLAALSSDVVWDWIKADWPGCRPPAKYLNQLLAKLRDPKQTEFIERVVKLPALHGQARGLIHDACDPVLVPNEVSDSESLLEWLVSPQANILPRRVWMGNVEEAALVAILSKITREKAFQKDIHGHNWVHHEHLLGDWPVGSDARIRMTATRMLESLDGELLIRKGNTQGKTPLEWCIRLRHAGAVKRTILEMSFDPMKIVPTLAPIIAQVSRGPERTFALHELINERVRFICRQL